MKKILSILLALALMLGAAALAEGNVTIAVQGMNDFSDNIQSMIVYGDKLLLSSWDTLYTWDNTSRKLTPVEGYDKLQNVLTGDGETPGVLELNDGEYAYLDGNLYAVGGKLYRMATISDEDGNSTNQLVELLIADDGALSLGEVIDLGDALCITESDGDQTYSYTRSLSNPCSFGNTLYALSYGDELELLALNLEDETVETLTLDVDGDVQSIAPYTEGKLLMTVGDYTTETPSTTLWLYDIENEEATELGALPASGYQTPDGLAYDEARGKMYYVLSGSVWRIDVSEDGLGEPEEFGDMPLMYANGNGVVYGDLYVLASYDAVVGRDVTLDKLPAQRMRVANGDYVDSINKAYYAFTDKHPEYMISISTTLDTDSLLQSMMNRDSSVDIYTLPSTSSAFTSLMNRGFMAELDGDATLSDAVDGMYGYLKDYVTKDGHIYALPMSGYANIMNINTKLLTEKLGYDVPDSWAGLFGILADISNTGKLEDMPEVMIVDQGYDKENFRSQLFYMMLADYFTWLDAGEENLTRGTQVLTDLCAAFETVDWDNLGLREQDDSEDGSTITLDYSYNNVLLEMSSLSLYSYVSSDGDQATPVALSVVEGEKPLIGQEVTFAFVNPFSEHKEEACEYLADAWQLVDQGNKIMFSPNESEPVLNSYYEENLKSINNSIADLQKTLDKTEDEEARESLQNDLNSMNEWLTEYEERGKYDVSPEQIEIYRAFGDNMAVQKSLIWNMDDGASQIQQYLDGAMNAQQLAGALEKTLQMQKLEGN